MLEHLNASAYASRPAAYAARPLESGIWFFPGEDAHAVMRWLSTVTERSIRSGSTTLKSLRVVIGRPLTVDSPEEETVVEVALDLPSSSITGTCQLSIEALTSTSEGLEPFLTIASTDVSTLNELYSALDDAFPAIMALTL